MKISVYNEGELVKGPITFNPTVRGAKTTIITPLGNVELECYSYEVETNPNYTNSYSRTVTCTPRDADVGVSNDMVLATKDIYQDNDRYNPVNQDNSSVRHIDAFTEWYLNDSERHFHVDRGTWTYETDRSAHDTAYVNFSRLRLACDGNSGKPVYAPTRYHGVDTTSLVCGRHLLKVSIASS